jgi:hypothetical protein
LQPSWGSSQIVWLPCSCFPAWSWSICIW